MKRALPWSATCFVCGDSNPTGLRARFVVDGDRVRLDTEVEEGFEGYHGQVHGGVISALLDETVGWACTHKVQRLCLTRELKVRFKKPVPSGARITVWGVVDEVANPLVSGHGWIEDAGGTVLATAEGTFFPVRRDVHDEVMGELKMPGRRARPDDI